MAMPSICIIRSALSAPTRPSVLRTGALVAWLNEGSCTDQVASASAAMPAMPISADADDLAHATARSGAQIVRDHVAEREGVAHCRHDQPNTLTIRWSASAVVSRSCTMATRI